MQKTGFRTSHIASLIFALALLLPFSAQADEISTWYDYDGVELRALDKITARSTTFKAKVGQTLKFADIFIKVRACRKPPSVEKEESASFIQVWEKDKKNDESQWVFSGWMFASSPALSAMDHPIYDVWVLGCTGVNPEPEPVIEPDPVIEEVPESENVEEGAEQNEALEESGVTNDEDSIQNDTEALLENLIGDEPLDEQ